MFQLMHSGQERANPSSLCRFVLLRLSMHDVPKMGHGFANSLEGLPEFPEHCYTHSYGLLR